MSDDVETHPLLFSATIPVPDTNQMSFANLVGPMGTLKPDAAAALTSAKDAREAMASYFQSEPPHAPLRQITVCEENLCNMIRISKAQQTGLNAEEFSLGQEEFSWTSMLTSGSLTAKWTSPYASLDAVFTAVALAGGHMGLAHQQITSGWNAASAMLAAKSLQTAAGVFLYAQEHVVPLLRSRGTGMHPPEVLTPVLLFMAAICMAQAQMCATAKAENDGKSPALLARLEAGIVDRFNEARRHLSTLAGADRGAVATKLTAFVDIYSNVATGMSLMHSGMAANANAEYAKAIGYMRDAVTAFSVPHDLAYVLGDAKPIAAITAVAAKARSLYASYKSDGDSVYFCMAAPESECPMAAAARIGKPVPFEYEEKGALDFSREKAATASPAVGAGAGTPAGLDSLRSTPTATPTPTPGASGATGMHITCGACEQVLAAPQGSAFIRCPKCTAINVQSSCPSCGKPCPFVKGATRVKCPNPACGKMNDVPAM